MARDEAKIRIRLDTGKAKSDLRAFTREAATTAKKLGSGVRGIVGRGLGAVGLGAGIGTGLAAARGAVSGGVGDIAGDLFGSTIEKAKGAVFGNKAADARAALRARTDVVRTLALQAGIRGDEEPSAGSISFFKSRYTRYQSEERGANMFRQSPEFYPTAQRVETTAKAVSSALGTVLSKAVTDVVNAIRESGGR